MEVKPGDGINTQETTWMPASLISFQSNRLLQRRTWPKPLQDVRRSESAHGCFLWRCYSINIPSICGWFPVEPRSYDAPGVFLEKPVRTRSPPAGFLPQVAHFKQLLSRPVQKPTEILMRSSGLMSLFGAADVTSTRRGHVTTLETGNILLS